MDNIMTKLFDFKYASTVFTVSTDKIEAVRAEYVEPILGSSAFGYRLHGVVVSTPVYDKIDDFGLIDGDFIPEDWDHVYHDNGQAASGDLFPPQD